MPFEKLRKKKYPEKNQQNQSVRRGEKKEKYTGWEGKKEITGIF